MEVVGESSDRVISAGAPKRADKAPTIDRELSIVTTYCDEHVCTYPVSLFLSSPGDCVVYGCLSLAITSDARNSRRPHPSSGGQHICR